MTDTLKIRVRALLALALVLPLALSLAGCKNFMKSDEDVKKTMEEEVEVANAPQVVVRVQSLYDNLGSVTPNGQATFKVNVPSNLLASELSGGFIRWAAFYAGSPTTEVPNAVSFANPKARETTAKVLVNRSDILIKAIFEELPKRDGEFPYRYNDSSMQDSMIRISFNKPINPSSFDFGVDTDGDGYTTRENGLFKNISLTMTIGGDITSLTSKYFLPPILSADRKTLIIRHVNSVLKDGAVLLPAGRLITVTLSKNITDSSGLKMAADDVYTYTVGSGTDQNLPELGQLAGGTALGSYVFTEASAPESRRTGAQNFYFLIKGEDVGGSVDYAEIIPTVAVYSSAGFVSSSTKAKLIEPWYIDEGTPVTIGDYGTDGLITLSVKITDINGNTSDVKTYQYIRDTAAPSVGDEQLARIKLTGSASSGYYNKNSTITFSEANPATDPIIDAGYAGGGSVPRLNSTHANLKYRFGFTNGSFTSWTAWTPVTTSVGLPISSYGSAESPNVPVYVQLMDDLGNTSIVNRKSFIAIDNTPPTGTVSFALDEVSGKKITMTTANVPFTITASDGMSGVAKYYVTETNLGSAPAKGDAGWKTYTPVAGAVSDTITFASQGTGDGAKTVYVWLMDNAENVTASALQAVAYKDGTRPTVSDFFLRAASPVDVNGSGTPVNPNATQYSNTKTFYFAFIADDGAGGIGLSKFNYADSAGGDSEDFRILANSALQGAEPLQVSNIAVAQIGTTSAWRVFGKLTVVETEDVHSITVRVKDFAGNVSEGLTNVGATNKCVYDSLSPDVTAVNLRDGASADCHRAAPTTFYTKDNTNTLSVTANDRGSGAVSGLKNATLAAVTAGTYTALPTLTFPGLEGLTTSGTANASLSFASGAVDGPKALVVTPYDYAGNSNPVTVYIYRDTAKPQVTLYLQNYEKNASFYKNAGAATAYPSSAQAAGFRTNWSVYLYPNAADYPVTNNAGLKNITYQLYKQTRNASGVLQTPVSQGAAYAGTLANTTWTLLSIPPETASANWIYGITATDNVGNVGDEERIGFIYDVMSPAVVTADTGNGARVTVYQAADPNTENVATFMNLTIPGIPGPVNCYVLPVQAFEEVGANATPGVNYASQPIYVYIRATDRPASDLSGSGIASTKNTFGYFHLNGSSYINPSPYINTATESSEASESSRYVLLPCTPSQPYWSMSSYSSAAFSPTVIDAVGNQGTPAGIRVAIDTGIPTASPSYVTYLGQDASVRYVNGSSSFSFTPTDPVDGYTYAHVKSGIKAYQFTATPAKPAADAAGWKPCTEGVSEVVTADFQALVSATPANAYLHVLDNAGNRGTYDLGVIEKDAAPPTYSITGVVDGTGKSAYKNGNFYYINTPIYRPVITFHDLVSGKGSGLANCSLTDFAFNGSSFLSNYSATQTVSEGSNTINGVTTPPYWSVHTAYQYMAFRFVVKDNAQNATPNVASVSTAALLASDLKVVYDDVGPTIAAYGTDVVFTNVSAGTQRNVSSSSTCSITPTDPLGASNQPASGVKSWILKRDDPTPPDDNDPGWKAASTATIDISTEFKGLVTASACSIYLFLKDNVGNVSGEIDLGNGSYFVKDDTYPAVTVTTMAQTHLGGSGGTSRFVRGDASISFSASDIGSSGVSKYLLSVSASETSASVAASGTAFTGDGTVTAVSAGPLSVASYFDTADARTLYLYVVDKAGNLTSYPVVTEDNAQGGTAVQARLDGTAPAVSSVVLASGSAHDKDGIIPVRINMSAADVSGVKIITLTGGVSTDLNTAANRNAITVKANTDAGNLDVESCVYAAGSLTITLDDPCVDSGYLTVSNMRVGSDDASVQTLTAKLTDAVGYSGATAQDSVTIDSSAPNIGTVTLADPTPWNAEYTNTTLVDMTIAQTDVGSGVKKIELSGSGFSSVDDTVTVNGSSTGFTHTASAITLDAAIASGTSIELTGIRINTGAGSKTVGVKLSDACDNTDSGSDGSDSITYDVTNPAISIDPPSGSYPDEVASVAANASGNTAKTYYIPGNTGTFTLSNTETNFDAYAVSPTAPNTGSAYTLSAGSTYTIYARDRAGNVSRNLVITVVKDSVRPIFSLTPSASYPSTVAEVTASTVADVPEIAYFTKNGNINFAFARSDINYPGTEEGSGLKSYTDGGSTNTTIPGSLSINANGTSHEIHVTDNIGNDSYHVTVKVTQDSAGPDITVTPPASGVKPGTANQTTYRTKDSYIDFTVDADDGTGSGTATCTVTGGDGSGALTPVSAGKWTARLNAHATQYTIRTTDNLGNEKTQSFTVTRDITPPSFGNWGITNSGSTINLSSVLASVSDVATETVDGSSVTPSATLTGLSYDAMHKITIADDLGNERTAYFVGVYESSTNIVLRVNDSPHWTVTDNASDSIINGLGIYRNSNAGTLTATCVDAATSSAAGTVEVSNSRISGFPLPHSSYYMLTLSYTASKKISFNFSVSGGTASPHAMIFGNPLIARRIDGENVVSTIRRESFYRARSASKTNLPVWYSETDTLNTRTQTERSDVSSVKAGKRATQAPSGTTMSGESLRSAALSGMKAPNAAVSRSAGESRTMANTRAKAIEKTVTIDYDTAVVMIAPEGSPAFVACARGVAALRQDTERSRAPSASGHDGPVNDGEIGERPEGIWEKLLSFFGFVLK